MKKNQIALLFLTLVVMLAVWYIKSPLNEGSNDQTVNTGEDVIIESSRLDAIVSLRAKETLKLLALMRLLLVLIHLYLKKKQQ